jgi:hypothetical protein
VRLRPHHDRGPCRRVSAEQHGRTSRARARPHHLSRLDRTEPMHQRPTPVAATIVSRALALPRPRPISVELTPLRPCETSGYGVMRDRERLQRLQRVTLVVTGFPQRDQRLTPKGYKLQIFAGFAPTRARAREGVCCNRVTCNHEGYMIEFIDKSRLQKGYKAGTVVTGADADAVAAKNSELNNQARRHGC